MAKLLPLGRWQLPQVSIYHKDGINESKSIKSFGMLTNGSFREATSAMVVTADLFGGRVTCLFFPKRRALGTAEQRIMNSIGVCLNVSLEAGIHRHSTLGYETPSSCEETRRLPEAA